MRGFWALLLLAVLQSIAAVPHPAFDAGKEYVYEYRARAVTGVKEDVNQFAGVGAIADVIIQHKDGHVIFKFDTKKMGHFNQKFAQLFEGQEFPVDYKDVPKTEQTNAFSLPISAEFENGVVKSFKSHPNDNVYSINAKKAVVSAFQLDLQGTKRDQVMPGQAQGDIPKTRSNDIFKVKEETVGGNCDTVYEIYSKPGTTNPEEHTLNVTKNRLYENCMDRPYYYHTNRRGYICETCPEKKEHHAFRQVSSNYYMIKGQREDYTIERIYHSSRFILNPFSTYGKTIIHGMNITMFLKEVKDIATPLALPADAKTHDSLLYTVPHDEKDPEHKDLTRSHFHERDYKNYKTQFDTYFKILTKNLHYTEDVKKHDITGKYTELIHLTESLNFDELKELFTAHANFDPTSATPEQKFQQRVFYDILSNIGTGPAFLLIKHVAENKKADNMVIENLIASYPYYCKEPSEKVVEEFIAMVKNLPVVPYSSLTSTSAMACGHMIHKALTTRKHYQHPKEHKYYMTRETGKKHFKKLFERFNGASTKWERLVYLATMQNIGMDESFPYIKDVVIDKEHKYSPLERISAIYALSKLSPKMHYQMKPLLLQIYRNQREHYHLRLAAFNLLLKFKPSYTLLHTIGSHLRWDHSQEVQSYVYSTFQSMANFSWPCVRHLKEHARSILEVIPSYDYGYGYSKNLVFDFHDRKYNYGSFVQVSYTGAKDSILPNSFHTRHTANVMGWNIDHFEFGVRTEGLSHIKNKLFGPEGIFNAHDVDKSLLNVFKRHPRNVNAVEKELQEIETSLKFQHKEEPKEKSFLMYFKALGQVVKMHYYDEKIFDHLAASTKDGISLPGEIIKMVENGIPINFRKIAHFADMHAAFPNEAGMPVITDLKIPMMLSVKGNFKAAFKPGFFSEERNGKKLTSIHINMDGHSIIDYQVIAKFGFVTPMQQNFGFGFTNEGIVKMPIRGEMEYNFHEKKYTGRMKPTDKAYEISSVKYTPFTYIHDHTSLTPLPEEKNIVPIQFMPKLLTQENTYFKDFWGGGLKFERKTDNHQLLYKGPYNALHKLVTKYGTFFENNDYGYTNTIAKKIGAALLYKHMSQGLTPRMPYYEQTITWEPDTQNKVTEWVETMQMNYSPEYHKPTMPSQSLQKEGENLVGTVKYTWEAKGPVVRKFDFDWKFVVETLHYTVRKVEFNYKRTPIPNYDTNAFHLCYKGSRTLPGDWHNVKTEEKSIFDATLKYGKDCASGAKITFHTVAEQSEAQKELIKNKEQNPLYKKCQEYVKKGFPYHWSCYILTTFYHTPHHWVANIKYENVPKSTHKILHKLEHYFQHKLYNNMEVHDDEATNEPNHIKVEMTTHPIKPFTHVHIYTPTTTTKYNYIWYPKYLPMHQKWNPFYNMKDLYLKAFFKNDYYPHCQVGGNIINTFDGVEYEFPQTDCWQLLTKDATEQDRFTVLYKHVKHSTHDKALKTFIGKHKIEVLSVDESSPMIVRIDGAKQDVADNKEFMFWDPEHPNTVLFSVEKIVKSETWYLVHVPRLFMDIWFDGKVVFLKASQLSRNRVLGLCGNFDSEKFGEFVGPEHCVYKNPLNFAYSWSVNADGCKIPAHQKEC